MEKGYKTEFNKVQGSKIEFKHTQEAEFKKGDKVLGMTTHVQSTIIDSKDEAVTFLQEEYDNVMEQVMKLQTEYDKNDMNVEDFKEIGEYLSANIKKTPIKKLTKLNTLYGKFENKTQLGKELDLYKSQASKIKEQLEEVKKL